MMPYAVNKHNRYAYPYHPDQRYPHKPMVNRGKAGKQRAVSKWRSRKARRRADKVTLLGDGVR